MSVPGSTTGVWPVRGDAGRQLLIDRGLSVGAASDPVDGAITRVALVDVRCTSIRLSAFRGVWRPRTESTRDTAWLVLHVAGASATRIDGFGAHDIAGAGRVVRVDSALEIVAPRSTERILVEFPLTTMSAAAAVALRRHDNRILGPSSLTRALIAFTAATVAGPPPAGSADAYNAERVLLSLIEAAIVIEPAEQPEAATRVDGDAVDAQVYTRACEIIDTDYAERDLGSDDVAERTGVSLRRLQRIFAERNDTVADRLRNRRLDAVAERLRAEPQADLAVIVEEAGFGAIDSVRRAFLARFGMTMREYRRAAPR